METTSFTYKTGPCSDVLIIGGGLAGMYSALAAAESGAAVRILCKSKTGGSGNSVVAMSVHRFAPDAPGLPAGAACAGLRPCWRQNARRGHCARHCACRCWGCLSFWRPGCWAVPLLILPDGRNGWRKRLRRCVPCWTGTPLPGWTAAVKGSCTGCSMK